MDFSFLKANPIYVLIAFLVYYFLIAKPLLNFDLIKSVVAFFVLYVLYMKFGSGITEKIKSISGSSFGKRRRR